MQMMTDQRKKLEPKMGRKTNASKLAEFGLLRPRQSRCGRSAKGQVTLDWREREHLLRVYAANKPISCTPPR